MILHSYRCPHSHATLSATVAWRVYHLMRGGVDGEGPGARSLAALAELADVPISRLRLVHLPTLFLALDNAYAYASTQEIALPTGTVVRCGRCGNFLDTLPCPAGCGADYLPADHDRRPRRTPTRPYFGDHAKAFPHVAVSRSESQYNGDPTDN